MPMSSDSWPKSKPTTDILVVTLVETRLYLVPRIGTNGCEFTKFFIYSLFLNIIPIFAHNI